MEYSFGPQGGGGGGGLTLRPFCLGLGPNHDVLTDVTASVTAGVLTIDNRPNHDVLTEVTASVTAGVLTIDNLATPEES